jgi:hypothetical protein
MSYCYKHAVSDIFNKVGVYNGENYGNKPSSSAFHILDPVVCGKK